MKHNRRSIRLKEYDYAQAGAYFVTICTQNRESLFGEIVGDEMHLNDAGEMIVLWYEELENKFPDIQCDAFVCMPNHIHFIVINTGVRADQRVCPNTETNNTTDVRADSVGADLRVCPGIRPNNPGDGARLGGHAGPPLPDVHSGDGAYSGGHAGPPRPGTSLSCVVQWFKTMTTNAYIHGVKQCQWPSFPGKLWQRNYYEHVIRNEPSCNRIREYIINNPMRWHVDRENLNAIPPSKESDFDALIDEVTK
jgi:REP element-mobilizing transposase RayT